jgi:hypothetical protein
MATLRDTYSRAGYSGAIAEKIAQAGRETSNAVYDAKWRKYEDWCFQQGYNPLSPSGPQLAEFFDHLFTHLGLAFSTLRGYKPSILSVLSTRKPLDGQVERDLNKIISVLF